MAYWLDIYRFKNSNEYEIKYVGKYGAKGEKRAKRVKPTPEQVAKQNLINRQNFVRRKIKLNFEENDYWLTFTFREKKDRTAKQVNDCLERMRRKLRRWYRKAGQELKWMARVEIGERGGIHAHMIVNRLHGADAAVLIQKAWEHGRVFFSFLYEEGGYKNLAEYLVKPPLDEHKDEPGLIPYSCSRNLKKPEAERQYFSRRTVRSLLEDDPKPTPGYYIEKDSIIRGTNKYTGYSYIKYTEVKLKPEGHRRI